MLINIASRLEPLWDRHLIEQLNGTHLRLHEPAAKEVVLHFDKPWETGGTGYPTMIQDGGMYRLYYRGAHDATAKWCACYCLAESRDGIHFERPAIGKHMVAGTTQNNVVHTGIGTHTFAPFIDTNPAALASQRYKALADNGKPNLERELLAFASPNGVDWSPMQEQSVFRKGAFDSHNVAFWSKHEGCYVCYYRIFSNKGDNWRQCEGIRTLARTTSKDFLNWSEPIEMHFGDTPLEELYTSGTHPYFRAPHLYVATPKRFVLHRKALSDDEINTYEVSRSQTKQVSEAVFMTTRGGDTFDRTFMEALIRPGLDRQNWVARNYQTAWGVVPTNDIEMSLYAMEHNGQPSCRLRRFTLRTDGFASIRAPYHGGEILTKPLTFTGHRLTMNYATSAAGSVRVELQDLQGQPIPGLSLNEATEHFGDRIEQVVSWGSHHDLSPLVGRPVRLRFVMKDADLYAIQFQ